MFLKIVYTNNYDDNRIYKQYHKKKIFHNYNYIYGFFCLRSICFI